MGTLDYARLEPPPPISTELVLTAALGPMLLMAVYVVLSRGFPGMPRGHNALTDWIALVASILAGLLFMVRAWRGRRGIMLVILVYIIVQGVWLFAVGLFIASHLERS